MNWKNDGRPVGRCNALRGTRWRVNPTVGANAGRRKTAKATAKKIETENKRGVTFGAWSRSRELGVGGKALTTADLHPWPAEKPRVNGAPALWRAAP